MNARTRRPLVERKAFRVPSEAAEVLGMQVTFFKTYVLPDLKVVRRGKLTFVSGAELDRWLDASSTP
jgi:hypothetical protein